MSTTNSPAGGAQPGRKPLQPGAKRVATSVSLTPAQAARLKALGGSAWLRHMLADDVEPTALRKPQRV